jgi:hypothetical protein
MAIQTLRLPGTPATALLPAIHPLRPLPCLHLPGARATRSHPRLGSAVESRAAFPARLLRARGCGDEIRLPRQPPRHPELAGHRIFISAKNEAYRLGGEAYLSRSRFSFRNASISASPATMPAAKFRFRHHQTPRPRRCRCRAHNNLPLTSPSGGFSFGRSIVERPCFLQRREHIATFAFTPVSIRRRFAT